MWNLPDGMKLDLCTKFGTELKKSDSLLAVPAARLSGSDFRALVI
ncbi:hypothetical protein WN943_027840 [Citrus x changshan-huyou]